MIVLAIDVGITSGVCVVEKCEGGVHSLSSSTLRVNDLHRLISLGMSVDAVVIEPVPVQPGGALSRDLSQVMSVITTMFPDARRVNPGIWKPVAESYRDVPAFGTKHERDAYCLGRYFLSKEGL